MEQSAEDRNFVPGCKDLLDFLWARAPERFKVFFLCFALGVFVYAQRLPVVPLALSCWDLLMKAEYEDTRALLP